MTPDQTQPIKGDKPVPTTLQSTLQQYLMGLQNLEKEIAALQQTRLMQLGAIEAVKALIEAEAPKSAAPAAPAAPESPAPKAEDADVVPFPKR